MEKKGIDIQAQPESGSSDLSSIGTVLLKKMVDSGQFECGFAFSRNLGGIQIACHTPKSYWS
jgi:hypothetical protein